MNKVIEGNGGAAGVHLKSENGAGTGGIPMGINSNNHGNSCVKSESEYSQSMIEAINNIHLRDFHQIFKQYKEQEQSKQELIKKELQFRPDLNGGVKSKKHKNGGNSDQIQNKPERNILYKTLLKKRIRREDENGQYWNGNQIKIEETMLDECAKHWTDENIVRKIDYDNLEVLLYKRQITDYHQLIDLINIWAISIGFLVKLKRSPKLNADGSQTLRLYCQSYKRSQPIDAINRVQYEKNPHCSFAMTFKQDDKTGCWLMYQEYSEDTMKHTHKLEKKRYDSIREYIQEYNDKVKTLSELKELIYDKFGLEYTLNQITYFKGRWTGEAVVVEREAGENECMHLVKLLRKGQEDFLEVEFDPNDKTNLLFMFYSTVKMKDCYLRNNDVIFINKRFSQNRFKRPLIMFFTVSNTGKSQLLGFSLIEKEEIYYFSKIAQCFLKHMNTVQPQTMIIERQLKLYQSFKENLPQTNILFCYFHIQRTFKQQYAFLEKEKLDDFNKIVELPMIENEEAFDQQLQEVNKMNFANEYYKLIIQKLSSERSIWPKWAHLQHFTGGISVCQRNEQIKTYLKPALKKRECAVSESLKRILTIDQKDFKLSHEYQKVSQKHEQVFRVAYFLNSIVKEQYTMYSYLRMKWNIARGFRFEVKEDREEYFILQLKQSNIANKKPWQPAAIQVKKILSKDGKRMGICECQEQFHSGFPCPHLCLLNYKGKLEHLELNYRWKKSKDKLTNGGEIQYSQKQRQQITQSHFKQENELKKAVQQQQNTKQTDQIKEMTNIDKEGENSLDVSQYLRKPQERIESEQPSDEDSSQDKIPIHKKSPPLTQEQLQEANINGGDMNEDQQMEEDDDEEDQENEDEEVQSELLQENQQIEEANQNDQDKSESENEGESDQQSQQEEEEQSMISRDPTEGNIRVVNRCEKTNQESQSDSEADTEGEEQENNDDELSDNNEEMSVNEESSTAHINNIPSEASKTKLQQSPMKSLIMINNKRREKQCNKYINQITKQKNKQ